MAEQSKNQITGDNHVTGSEQEKDSLGSALFQGLTSLFPYPMRWVGSFVFLCATLSAVFFLLVPASQFGIGIMDGSSVSSQSPFGPAEKYFQFETISILLRIAAVALVLAALSGERNALVLVIGLLLVGALIVPTKDMMRFYLAATNSDRKINDFFSDAGSAPELRGRDPQLAASIIDSLDQAGALDLARYSKPDLYWIVEEDIAQERITTLLERTRAHNALEILRHIQANRVIQIGYRFAEEDQFASTLRFLRNASLISYYADDLDTLRVTDLGLRVLHQARSDGFSASGERPSESPLFEDCWPEGNAPPIQFGSRQQSSTPVNEIHARRSVRLGLGPTYARFNVAEDTESLGIWVLKSRGFSRTNYAQENESGVPDPIIELIDVASDCEVIHSAGAGYADAAENEKLDNAFIRRNLSKGDYLIRVLDNNRTRGRIDLALTTPLYSPTRLDRFSSSDFPESSTALCNDFSELSPELNPPEIINLGRNGYRIIYSVAESGLIQLESFGTDTILAAQAVNSVEDCRDNAWFEDDDSGTNLGSLLEMVAREDEMLLVSVMPFDPEFDTGTVELVYTGPSSVARTSGTGTEPAESTPSDLQGD